MKWLVLAATILISLETSVEAFQFSSQSQVWFANNIPSASKRTVTGVPTQHSKLMDANSYLSIGPKQRTYNGMYNDEPSSSTALSMGIRSILGLGRNNNKKNDDDGKSENPEDIKLALEAIKRDLEAVTAEEKKKKKKASAAPKKKKTQKVNAAKAENNVNANANANVPKIKVPEIKKNMLQRNIGRAQKEVVAEPTSADTYGETVRDRINRVKSGHMTDEEKAAFLNSALTRTPPGSNGPPIRQAIPSPGDYSRGSNSGSGKSASPFPKDALWNTIVSNGQSSNSSGQGSSSRYGNMNLTGNNDSAKREYLDMVTNPDRFKSYAAMGGYRSSSGSADSVDVDGDGDNDGKGKVVENLNMLETPNVEDAEGDLASRLESAAILKEKQDAEAKAKKEEEEKTKQAKFQEEQRRRADEIRRLEEEKVAAKRAADEEKMNVERHAIEAEKKRLSDMQAAQDAYWAKKLEEENSRKEKLLSVDEKKSMEEERRMEAEARLAKFAREAAKQAEIEALREAERKREDPHESEILKEAAEDDLHKRERNADIMERSAAFTSNTVPQQRSDDVSSNAFVEQQEKKKAALDEFMKEQNDRLASLNSPLPSFLPKIGNPKPKPAASKPPTVIPSLNLTDLTMKKNKKPTEASKPASPPPASPAPRLNLADLTMAKKPASPARAPSPPPADTTPRLSLAEMTMLKKPQTGGAPPSTPSKKKISSSPSSGSKPIRQNIPITQNDDEEDDFFEYSRGGGNSGMSIKDIMARADGSGSSGNKESDTAKAQSKMWGIDIDKFTD